MIRKLCSLAALALLALAFVSGCDQLGSESNAIIGSIFLDFPIEGGKAFHVLMLDSSTTLDPYSPGSVDGVSTVAEYDGNLPGDAGDDVWTANYMITGVPQGAYYLFAWIDWDGDGSFSSGSAIFGFYNGVEWSDQLPDVANVSVPEAGVVDIDVYISVPN